MRRSASVLALAALVLLLAAPTGMAVAQGTADPKTAAEIEKLKEETSKLKRDNGLLGRLPAYGAVFAALVALGSLVVAARKQQQDAAKERQKDNEEERREQVRRFDEQFTAMVDRITSTEKAVRASAAASVRAFLKDEHRAFHEQVVSLLGANLKFPQENDTDRVIERVFADALRSNRDRLPEILGGYPLDLYKAQLRRVDLAGLGLDDCDMVEANLRGVILEGASLMRARGLKVDLSEAVLVRANLEEARMRGANIKQARLGDSRLVSAKLTAAVAERASFDGAQMQDANLDDADLRAATFHGANLNNTFFRGAKLDEPALRSILKAENWKKANFDADTRARLDALAAA